MSIGELVRGPQISELAGVLLELLPREVEPVSEKTQAAPRAAKAKSRNHPGDIKHWLANREIETHARTRLFCFPPGVQGPATYRQWQPLFPAEIQVCPVSLPGRESRFKELPPENLEELIDMLETALTPVLDRPYALFGHSAGALIAFRLARRLRQNAQIPPMHFFAGAYSSPVIPNPFLYKKIAEFKAAGFDSIPGPDQVTPESARAIHRILNESEFENLIMKDPEFIKRYVLALRMLEGYYKNNDKNEPPTDIPITAFHGKNDPVVSEKDMAAWAPLTTAPFQLHILPGDHMFLLPDQSLNALCELMAEKLTAK